MDKNILLLNGSTRIKGNSLNICNSFKTLCSDHGVPCDILNIQQYFNNKDIKALREAINRSNIIGLVCPLYVDGFPYPVIDFLETMELECKDLLIGKGFFVIGQCNFPESRRITPLIQSGKCFCAETNMKWLGNLSYGGAIRIESKPLEGAGREGARMIKALNIAIEDIINNREISSSAQKLFKNDINRVLYKPFITIANIMFSKQ